MNTEIKLNLNIVLPGRIMFSKEECLKTTQKVIEVLNNKTGKTYKKRIKEIIEDFDKMDKHYIKVLDYVNNKTVSETLTFYTRKSIPVTQSLNICKDAYNYMISSECPIFSKPKVWNSMSKKERLEAHLQKITESLSGISYTYQIFED